MGVQRAAATDLAHDDEERETEVTRRTAKFESRDPDEEEDDDDEVKTSELQPWDSVPGKMDICAVVVAVCAVLLGIGALVLCALAYTTDWFDRDDAFHPQRSALTARHWQHWERQFTDARCIPITVIGSATAAGFPADLNYLYENCTFRVPYTAVFGAMACSFVGIAAVALYARNVRSQPRGTEEMSSLADIIHEAAMTFMHQEYEWLLPSVLLLSIFLFLAIDAQENDYVPAASASFLWGAMVSASCSYMGTFIATEGNCRAAAACYSDEAVGLSRGLHVAFRTGACMGLGVVSFSVSGLTISYAAFANTAALGGFGFGSSAVALFARVGGGIYTKAADVGADSCGKVDNALAEDSPKNPATIADCVGDNVGDVAGMGADLFESFVGAVVAACVLGAAEFGEKGVAFPFYLIMIGLVVCIVCTLYVRVADSTGNLDSLLAALRTNLLMAAGLMAAVSVFLAVFLFEEEGSVLDDIRWLPFEETNPGPRLFGCIMLGLVVGILIGMVTEYFTSHTSNPTKSIGRAAEFGAGPVIIRGLSVGMLSTTVPLLLIVAAVLGSYYLAGFYGTAIAVVGMMSTLGVTMSTAACGPVADNAGGIAEMSELPPWVRKHTDALDALGNTTAATGKGFANGSALLSSLALCVAYVRVADIENVNALRPVVVIGFLVGSMLPYVFGAMTMLGVNKAAQEMMHEVRRQFLDKPDILTNPTIMPDYRRCIIIGCNSSLRGMLMPGVLAIFAPLITGLLFGAHALVGLLIGAIGSGYLLGVVMSNTGSAWNNAKRWIEAGHFVVDGVVMGKATNCHKAAVCGDTVGDPFKDTSGPSLNVLIKFMTRFAFVCAPLFDDGWDFWWIGLILLGAAISIIAIIRSCILKKTLHSGYEIFVPKTVDE